MSAQREFIIMKGDDYAMKTPCDYPDEFGRYHCPFEDYGGYESERCRVCCGLGVDEGSYGYEDEDFDY